MADIGSDSFFERDFAMVKLVYVIRRKSNLSVEEFERYWLQTHGPKVRSVARELRALRYVQSHPRMPDTNEAFVESRGLGKPYDGITELWWEKPEDLEQALASSEGDAAARMLIGDESEFIDFAESCMFMTEEFTIF